CPGLPRARMMVPYTACLLPSRTSSAGAHPPAHLPGMLSDVSQRGEQNRPYSSLIPAFADNRSFPAALPGAETLSQTEDSCGAALSGVDLGGGRSCRA